MTAPNTTALMQSSAAVLTGPVATNVSDHVARTLLRQGYDELGEAERRLIDRIVAYAPDAAVPVAQPSWLDRLADRVADARDRAAAEYNAAVSVHTKLDILRLHERLDRIERGLFGRA